MGDQLRGRTGDKVAAFTAGMAVGAAAVAGSLAGLVLGVLARFGLNPFRRR